MSRYIKFDDAVKIMACEMYAEAQSQGYDVDGIEDFMPEAKAWITDAPSIDIVRCKDCRHSEESLVSGSVYCNEMDRAISENGFCHKGERKEGE